MKKLILILMITMILAFTIGIAEARPLLPRDANGTAMQFHKTFTVERDSCNAVTIHKATVPTNAVEAILWVKTAPIFICPDSTATLLNYAEIPAGMVVRIPVTNMTKFYYRSVTATASILNIIWCKD